MMYVHVNPGFDAGLYSGAQLYLGVFIVDFLGRTSVAALSVVSGFLLASAAVRKPAGTLIWDRVRTIYIPMLVWSAIFISLAQASYLFAGVKTSTSTALEGLPISQIILEKLMFLYGAPASQALGFLRDLTVSGILVVLLLRLPGKVAIGGAFCVVFGFAVYGSMAPLVYRPTIFLFMLAGVLIYQKQRTLDVGAPIVFAAAIGFAVFLFLGLSNIGENEVKLEPDVVRNLSNIIKRACLAVLALSLGSLLVATSFGKWLSGIGAHIYLAFLCHTSLLPIFWVVWKICVGDELHGAYPVFFLFAPLSVIGFSIIFNKFIDKLPKAVQIGLRGKALS